MCGLKCTQNYSHQKVGKNLNSRVQPIANWGMVQNYNLTLGGEGVEGRKEPPNQNACHPSKYLASFFYLNWRHNQLSNVIILDMSEYVQGLK